MAWRKMSFIWLDGFLENFPDDDYVTTKTSTKSQGSVRWNEGQNTVRDRIKTTYGFNLSVILVILAIFSQYWGLVR
jgi:hypothetical protein